MEAEVWSVGCRDSLPAWLGLVQSEQISGGLGLKHRGEWRGGRWRYVRSRVMFTPCYTDVDESHALGQACAKGERHLERLHKSLTITVPKGNLTF